MNRDQSATISAAPAWINDVLRDIAADSSPDIPESYLNEAVNRGLVRVSYGWGDDEYYYLTRQGRVELGLAKPLPLPVAKALASLRSLGYMISFVVVITALLSVPFILSQPNRESICANDPGAPVCQNPPAEFPGVMP